MGVGTRSRSYEYDALGNLIYRSDIGTLSYGQTNGAGVHAVTAANGQNYQYDHYGNMVQRGADLVEYDVFNKPTKIGSTYFSYGPDHARFKQVNGDRTTYYLNGGLYEEIVEGAVTTTKSYVGGYLVRAETAGQTSFTYLHKDHLGSVDAMTDQWGNLIDRMSFDPWGQRQYADWADGNPTNGDPDYYPTTKGYTGHEMLDQENLIHMNGRVYDPVIGRFLSPDLLISLPYNTQSFNRYSYVLNNPLSLVDPSGYMEEVVSYGKSGMDCRGGCPEIEKRMFRTQATFFTQDYLRQQNSFFQDSTAQYFAQQGDPFQNVDFNIDLSQGNGGKNSDQGEQWVNPTGNDVRGCASDNYGCGMYGSSRDGGTRTHKGADFIGSSGQTVRALTTGEVTKIGYPYADDLSLRYVEITAKGGFQVRQFYVQPFSGIEVGSNVMAGQGIGSLQSLQGRYPGITDHSHTEIRQNGSPINPIQVIPFQ